MGPADDGITINIGVTALEKLIDVIAAGIGSIAGPLIAPWAAGRHTKAAITAAKGEAEVREILATSEANTMQITAQAQSEARRYLETTEASSVPALTAEHVSEALQFQQERRLRNIEAIATAAATELGDETVMDETPDPDWIARFFGEAQEVSSAKMQQLWARILAGEVRQPRTTSIRTLEILRNLDPRVASTFKKLCSVSSGLAVIGNIQMTSPLDLDVGFLDPTHNMLLLDQRVVAFGGNAASNALESYGLAFGTLNVLNEYGLIISEYNSWRDYQMCIAQPNTGQPAPFRLVHGGRQWILRPDNVPFQSELKLSGVALTSAGRELASVVELEPNEQYLKEYRSYLARKRLHMVEIPTVS